ncbi:hypothetical protein A1F94_012430 [Pyrenophora tritici-repentis]|nr:hypothetical protein A1F94_012430 [Pyrenophora tritici-repentis]
MTPTITHPPTANWFKADSSPTTHLDTNLPKNFRQPLTCFFWCQYKRCSRSSAECPYAHYDTGLYAKAPFGLEKSPASVPTAEAHASTTTEIERMRLEVQDKISALAQRERDVEDREKDVEERERQFARKMRGVEKALGVREKTVKRREEALWRGVVGDVDT